MLEQLNTIQTTNGTFAHWEWLSLRSGIPLGLHAIHPFTGAPVPVYVADYVISDYGTKAVMGISFEPQHSVHKSL